MQSDLIHPIRGIFNLGNISVSSTATKIYTPTYTVSLIIYNSGTTVAYLGNKSVASSGANQGLQIAGGSYSPSMTLADTMTLYAITASGTTTFNGIVIA